MPDSRAPSPLPDPSPSPAGADGPVASGPGADELADLLEAVAARHDRVAFAGLFRHFAPRIKSWLLRAGLPEATAEELAQETLVQLWRKAALFDRRKAAASTWVFTIARNLRIDHQRRGALRPEAPAAAFDDEGRHDAADDAVDVADTARPPDEALDAARRAGQLRAALERLPEEQREILRRSFYEEQPHAAIAEALALPLGTVKSRIRLAVGHLRRQLGHLMP